MFATVVELRLANSTPPADKENKKCCGIKDEINPRVLKKKHSIFSYLWTLGVVECLGCFVGGYWCQKVLITLIIW